MLQHIHKTMLQIYIYIDETCSFVGEEKKKTTTEE